MPLASATCEVLRRFIWNFFRLENEHLNNCDKLQAFREIDLPFKRDLFFNEMIDVEREGSFEPADNGDHGEQIDINCLSHGIIQEAPK